MNNKLRYGLFLPIIFMTSGFRPYPVVENIEHVAYFNTMLQRAIELEVHLHYDDAIYLYDQIITTHYALPSNLRFKALFHKADIRNVQCTRLENQEYCLESRNLLNEILAAQPTMMDPDIRAEAHLLLAKMDEDGTGLPFGMRDPRAAAQHYLAVLQEGACDDPSLIFEAALGYAELVYRYPTVPHLPEHLITAYRIMMKSYKNMGADEKEDISNLEAFHNAKLHYALKLFQGAGLPDNKPDYRKARVLLHDIVRSPEYEINPITLNRARALLASMYLRGEGRPDNAPDLSKAALLYEKIMNAPEENVREEDRTEAELALAMINKRQAEEDISQQPSKRQR